MTRLLSLGLLLSWLVPQGLAAWHLALATHAPCIEHGELMELEGEAQAQSWSGATALTRVATALTRVGTALTQGNARAATEHHHCALMLGQTQSWPLQSPYACCTTVPQPAATAWPNAQSSAQCGLAPLHLAPKNSPPTSYVS